MPFSAKCKYSKNTHKLYVISFRGTHPHDNSRTIFNIPKGI